MKMKYQQLTDHILQHLPPTYRANFYSGISQGKLLNIGKNITVDSRQVGQIESEVFFWFEALPFREISPEKIMAIIQIWLDQYDEIAEQLDIYEVPFEITHVDDNTVDLEFTLKFHDSLCAVEDENGDLEIDGKKYRLDEVEINWAEQIIVKTKYENRKNVQFRANATIP